MPELNQVVWGHDERIKMLEARAQEDRQASEARFVQLTAHVEGRLAKFEGALNSVVDKLDEIGEKQDVAVGVREAQTAMMKTWLGIITVLIPAVGIIIDLVRRRFF